MDGRTHGHTENIYSIFRDKLLLLGEHIFGSLPPTGAPRGGGLIKQITFVKH